MDSGYFYVKPAVLQDDLIDEEGSDKIKRDLDVAENNIQLFRELLENWNPDDGPLEVRWFRLHSSLSLHTHGVGPPG